MIWAVTAVAQANKVSGIISGAIGFINKLACKAKGSARPHLLEAVRKIGYQGYTRNHAGGTAYFTQFGELLIDQATINKWYFATVWQKMKDTGIDACFIASTNAPTEIFTPAADGQTYIGYNTLQLRGVNILVDKRGYDSSAINAEKANAIVGTELVLPANDGGSSAGATRSNIFLFVGAIVVGFILVPIFARK